MPRLRRVSLSLAITIIMKRHLLFTAFLTFALLSCAVQAKEVVVTDVAGRQVHIDTPVKRMILGEGRQIYLLSVLQPKTPFEGVVGWREDLAQADPETYEAYAARFPELRNIPTFGGFKDGTFDVEQAAALKPDVVFMNIEAKTATEDAGRQACGPGHPHRLCRLP